ncbi:MAG: hypothetical protein PWQ29_314 [Verrucomicrobiota bacterium]|jgi:3',5'-cyclic AMP phosphodiesterase CpdA|nr:hypothetical protein [Verrucomicrobiota bacterium]MDK2962920.1 hypothetical protein [Verrucomicrobiota bacterium]
MKRIALLLLLLFSVVRSTADDSLFFVQITDTHFGQGDHLERARTVVKAINALPVDIAFVAVTGDIMDDCITDSHTVDAARTVLNRLKMPVHFVPGNHDLLTAAPEKTAAAFTNRFGPLISDAEYGGVEFVFVCTEPLAGGARPKGYDPLKELENRFRSYAPNQPIVVFHHTPSVGNFYQNIFHPGWGRSEAGRQWTERLNRYPVKAVIAGHFHRDEFHWLGDIPLFVCPPLSGRFGRQAAFRVYKYHDGKVEYRTQYPE